MSIFVRAVWGVGLASGLLVLTQCAPALSGKDVLQVGIEGEPVTLDPRLSSDAYSEKIGRLIFSGLFRMDDTLSPVPDLALRYEQPAATVYRVFLRPGVHFQNGDALTAADVVFTIRSIIDGSVASPYRAAFERVAQVVAEDPLTVRFELKEPYAPFLIALCRGIVPLKVVAEKGEAFGRQPIGTGPYRFVRWVDGSSIELAANPDYYAEQPKTPRLIFQIIKDDNVRVLKLLKGELDYVQNAIPLALLAKVGENPDVVTKAEGGVVAAYIGINLSDPILKDVRVRKAIAMGLNRDELIAHRRFGFAQKANSILSPLNWAYDPSLGEIPFDPQAAKRLLDAAGHRDPDGNGPKMRFTLSFKTSTVKERVDIVQMIAHQLAAIGIGVNVESYEWGTFFRDVRSGNFQLYSLSWVGVSDPDIYHDVFASTQLPPDGLNRGRYRNPVIDRLVEAGRLTSDRNERKAIYAQVQHIVLDELPQIPLWYEHNVVVYRTTLSGVRLRPDASFALLTAIAKK